MLSPSGVVALRTKRVLAALFILALAGCTLFRSQNLGDEDEDLVTVTVVNHHRLDVTLYNVRQGRRDRLGDVTAVTTRSFKVHLKRLPSNELQLFADPIGSNQGITSELLHLTPGDTVEWTLESGLARSHVMIR